MEELVGNFKSMTNINPTIDSLAANIHPQDTPYAKEAGVRKAWATWLFDARDKLAKHVGVEPGELKIEIKRENITILGDIMVIGPQIGIYTIRTKDALIAEFYISRMPGCCGICVSWGARTLHRNTTAPNSRWPGWGTLLNNYRKGLGHILGYTVMLGTDIQSNTNQLKIFDRNKWKCLYEFINRRTKNKVGLYVVDISRLEVL